MRDINTIQQDSRFDQFCALACELEKDYGVKVWHSNHHILPEGADPTKPEWDIIQAFYIPLERYGYDLSYQVYCYGSPKED